MASCLFTPRRLIQCEPKSSLVAQRPECVPNRPGPAPEQAIGSRIRTQSIAVDNRKSGSITADLRSVATRRWQGENCCQREACGARSRSVWSDLVICLTSLGSQARPAAASTAACPPFGQSGSG
jgi:hypothetical protein